MHQYKVRHKYHRLLLELGDKWYSPAESQWPIEYRLMFIACIQTTIFVVGNIISQKGGPMAQTFFNMILNPSNGHPPATAYAPPSGETRGSRMRGPRQRVTPPSSDHYDDNSEEEISPPKRRRRSKRE